MARKKGTPIGKASRKGLVDGRYKKPLDPRAQERKFKKDLKRLREL